MNLTKRLLVLPALVLLVAGAQAQARPSRRKSIRKLKDKIRKAREAYDRNKESNGSDGSYLGRAGDAEKPVEWMTDFAAAARLASEEKRPMMILFSTRELMEKSRSCTFDANSTRRAVRKSKVVPVRILPPVRRPVDKTAGKEEIAGRKELYRKELKKYRELVKRYLISSGPSLIFAAPDAKRLDGLVAPDKAAIERRLWHLGDLLAAYEKARSKKKPGDAGKPDAAGPARAPGEDEKDGGKAEEKKDDEVVKKQEKEEARKKAAGDPDDDF